jgi:PD-(D/E)XK nuclease superfamily
LDYNNLKTLIDEYKKLAINKISYEPTFMEISGYPHYENVCTNILSFFFDTSEVHNMKDLLLRALFKVMGLDVTDLIVNEVVREQVTSENKRIDLVILTDEFVIGIENKIFAGLYNDLDIYSNYLKTIQNDRKLYKIVLSLNRITNASNEFINITYSELFNAIDDLMSFYWKEIDNKYFLFLKDFIKTINNLKGDNDMDNSQVLNYISTNLEDIEAFMKFTNDLKKNIKTKVETLSQVVNYKDKSCKQWFYTRNEDLGYDLVHDISVEDSIVAIDTWYKPNIWKLSIWLRRGGRQLTSKNDLSNWLVSKGVDDNDINIQDNNRNILVKEFQTMEEVTVYLNDLLEKLCN